MKPLKPLLLIASFWFVVAVQGCVSDETVPPKKLVDDMNKQRMMQSSGPQNGGGPGGAPGGVPPQTGGK